MSAFDDWTADETDRMGALAVLVEAAMPTATVYAYRRQFDEVTGFPLHRDQWRWQLSAEWDVDGRLHQRMIETEHLLDLERGLPRWLAVVEVPA